jgi:putative NIF3 family GTP cyclohydrolase 1 type 2
MLKHMRFAIVLLCLLSLSAVAPAQTLTAAQAIQLIQQRYPAERPADTVDTIKAGDPATIVTGIATTFLDTMDVLREANRRGLNLVITHEPTFYNHPDDTAFFKDDPVYLEKRAFIEQHHMVVYRLHDAIHDVPPDHIELGLIDALGWRKYVRADDPFFATIPPTTLGALAKDLSAKFNVHTMRIVGRPDLAITKVALLPGAAGSQKQIEALRRDDVDVILIGEVPEWETVEYIRDAAAQGRAKGLILLGHEVSEEPGMEQCTRDLKAVFPKLRVEHIVAGSPTWNSDYPPVSRTR